MTQEREPGTPEERARTSGSIWREEWGGIGFTLLMLLIVVFSIGWVVVSLV
jgi:hypothetical protein